MWNVKEKLMPLIIDTDSTWATYQESTKLRKYKNSHTGHCTQTAESANVKGQNIFHITLHVAQIVNTEQLQHHVH
jgi:hypothetical protein